MDIDESTKPIVTQTRAEAVGERLREWIRSGRYGPQGKIPPERELASMFGVNRLTVARAISGLVSEGLIQRKVGSGTYVTEAADAVGEEPKGLATVNVVLPMPPGGEDVDAFLGRPGVAEAAYEYFSRRGVKVSLAFFREPRELGPLVMDLARERNAAHIIWYSPDDGTAEGLYALRRAARVFCLVDAIEPEVPSDSVATDHALGGRMLARLLLDAGHRSLLYVTDNPRKRTLRERRDGFMDEVARAGAKAVDALWDRLSAAPGELEGALAGAGATAVGCSNDFIALLLMDRFAASGRSVPEDISLAGFDGLAATRYCRPALTTLRQEFYRIGLAAADLVHRRWGDEGMPVVERKIPPVVLRRDSIGAPKDGHTAARSLL